MKSSIGPFVIRLELTSEAEDSEIHGLRFDGLSVRLEGGRSTAISFVERTKVAGQMANLCVFCGSRTGDHPDFVAVAKQLGQYMAGEGLTMVYGGGSTGIMGAIADAMLENDGRIIGVIPEHLARVELMHADVSDMRITRNMHERKALMHELSDLYVTLPGGFGTMEELFEAVTWAQLELHARPIVLLNLHGLYDGIVDLVASMTDRGFLSPKCQQLMTVVSTVDELIEWLKEKLGARL